MAALLIPDPRADGGQAWTRVSNLILGTNHPPIGVVLFIASSIA